MKEQIKDLIKRYQNSLDSWKDSLRTYNNKLDKTPLSDRELCSYWSCQVEMGRAKVETFIQIIKDLKSLLKQEK